MVVIAAAVLVVAVVVEDTGERAASLATGPPKTLLRKLCTKVTRLGYSARICSRNQGCGRSGNKARER